MKEILYVFCFAFIIIVIGNTVIVAQTDMKPPVAKKDPKTTKIHGYEVTDNYAWLRDRNKEKNPEIIKYLKDENAYTDSFMNPHKNFIDNLYQEMLGRIKQDDTSVPYKKGGFWYYNKPKKENSIRFISEANPETEKIPKCFLDLNEMAKGFEYFAIDEFDVSDDDNILAFSTDTTGYRQYTLQFKDLRTGKMLPDKIERVTSSAWSNDGKYVFVVQEHEVSKRSDKLWRHEVGTDKNELLYEEKDPLFNLQVGKTRDNQMIIVSAFAKTMREARYIPADKPLADWKIVLPREEGHEYSVDHYGSEFYIVTNKNAENFRVVRAPVSDPAEKNWKDFIPHNPAIKIEDINFFKDYAVVSELENGLEYLQVMDLKTNQCRKANRHAGKRLYDEYGNKSRIRYAVYQI